MRGGKFTEKEIILFIGMIIGSVIVSFLFFAGLMYFGYELMKRLIG